MLVFSKATIFRNSNEIILYRGFKIHMGYRMQRIIELLGVLITLD